MKLLIIIFILFVFYLLYFKKEHFENLPKKIFTELPTDIKYYQTNQIIYFLSEKKSKDLFHLIFNSTNPYLHTIWKKKVTLRSVIASRCYIDSNEKIKSVLKIVSNYLKNKYYIDDVWIKSIENGSLKIYEFFKLKNIYLFKIFNKFFKKHFPKELLSRKRLYYILSKVIFNYIFIYKIGNSYELKDITIYEIIFKALESYNLFINDDYESKIIMKILERRILLTLNDLINHFYNQYDFLDNYLNKKINLLTVRSYIFGGESNYFFDNYISISC